MFRGSNVDDLRLDGSEVESFIVDAYLLKRSFLLKGRMMGIHGYKV